MVLCFLRFNDLNKQTAPLNLPRQQKTAKNGTDLLQKTVQKTGQIYLLWSIQKNSSVPPFYVPLFTTFMMFVPLLHNP